MSKPLPLSPEDADDELLVANSWSVIKLLEEFDAQDLTTVSRPYAYVADHVVRYAVNLVRHTRPKETGAPEFIARNVSWGAGPRASQFLVLGAKARAILHGRFAATADDVRAVARPVLRHRVLPNFHAESEGISSLRLVEQLLELVKAA